ncbi:hypothetical protein SAMN05216188_12728 [Lentzea xinjiangensis]|uniref:Heparinase II/III-like protein n=1 Tax=Lentzea xinjiangensis TaxID=402600 RepID=A0A1H9VN27_9PSEU|nr:hypothetical protein [Lentzea xinjiangensis]SES22979.1 hypothetical protein SAMN05216188_12728 [Lentzea xinjiangensis]
MNAFSRRSLITGATAIGLLATMPSAALALPAPPPVTPDRRSFAPEEQRFAQYLMLVSPMVADMTGDGFFAGGWWRSPNAPYNARVQEHVYTLAWFATQSRPWNPYRGNANLVSALDAGLGHYLGLQHADGSWPEYSATQHSLAATGFGMGYLSKTNALLRRAGVLPGRQAQISAALRRAMTWFLDPSNDTVWQSPLTWANQTTAGLAGAALALKQDPDTLLRQRLTEAFTRLAATGQSPAGFFYEESGADTNYNFEVMLPEMADAWRQTGDATLVAMARRYTEWLGYNLLREPDGSGWFANIAPNSRTSSRFYADVRPDPERTALNNQFVPVVPDLAAFLSSREDLAAARTAWAADPAPVPPLVKPDTSPRVLTHAIYGERYPSRAERTAAIARLPQHRAHFTERRSDQGQDFLFVRRPKFYVGGYFGARRATSLARTGLTFLWHPVAGTLVQSMNNNNHACWATVLPGQVPDSNGPQQAEFLGGEPYRFRYRTPSGSVVTEVAVGDRIVRSVRATSAATEQIPLVVRDSDTVVLDARGLTLTRGRVVVRFDWARTLEPRLRTASSITYPGRRLQILTVPHDGTLTLVVSAS